MFETSLCRLCRSNLTKFLDLGSSPISGQFPRVGEHTKSMPLVLARCSNCNLIQLYHRLPILELYSESYGYESHLNISMEKHLHSKAKSLQSIYHQRSNFSNGVFLDIASNDGTFLAGYTNKDNINFLVGIDPLISNFNDHYPKKAIKIEDFFTQEVYLKKLNMKSDIVSSISVFYDLDDPIRFAQDVFAILSSEGIWHLEQSYCVSMIKQMSFDTICHEHLLYLRAQDFKSIFDRVGFTVVEANLNEINGGSLALTVEKSKGFDHCYEFNQLIDNEIKEGFCDIAVYREFAKRVLQYKTKMKQTILNYKSAGYKIVGLGASTKGNIILSHVGLDFSVIDAIGEVNPKKFGRVTPGTNIPIIAENMILESSDRMLAIVLPWHFRDSFIEKTKVFRARGNLLLFPLPEIEII